MRKTERIQWLKVQLQALKAEARSLPFQSARSEGLLAAIEEIERELAAETESSPAVAPRIAPEGNA